MERGIARSDYVLELLSTWEGDAEFNRVFDGTKYADKFWPQIDKSRVPLLGWDETDQRSLHRMGYWRNRPLHREPTEHDWGEEACEKAYFLLKKEGIDPYGVGPLPGTQNVDSDLPPFEKYNDYPEWKKKLKNDTLLAKDFIDAHQNKIGSGGGFTLFRIIEDVLGAKIDFDTVDSDEIVERLDAKFS